MPHASTGQRACALSLFPPAPRAAPSPAPQATPRDSETSIELPCALVHSSLHHLTATLAEAARLGQELVELRNSRVQHLPPSAWVKREHKYKQDHEKFEHTVNMQRQRIAKLEAEVAVLREGASIRPLEEKIEVRRALEPARGRVAECVLVCVRGRSW